MVYPTESSGQDWTEEVLRFWFAELQPDDWFRFDRRIDAMIRQRFLAVHATLAGSSSAASNPRQALAEVVVLDQFSRNIFRGTPAAYASDEAALRMARAAVAAGFDASLSLAERQFLYMPFLHSEDRAAQRQSVDLFAMLEPGQLKYAEQHRATIERFGRFPHRNAILGRVSTPEEIEYLRSAPRLV
jgi:uncharacterized protein (DUF924 family)